MGKVDLDFQAETGVVGREFAEARLGLDAHRLQHAQIAAGGGGFDNASGVHSGDEFFGATIEDGHFRAVDLDVGIVDAEAGEAGHQVLDGRNGGAALVAQHGGEVAALHGTAAGADGLGRVGTMKNDAGIGRSRSQAQPRHLSGMYADARKGNTVSKSGLPYSIHPDHRADDTQSAPPSSKPTELTATDLY